MILWSVKAATSVALAVLAVVPARADVLEIGAGGESRWVTGPNVVQTRPVNPSPVAADFVLPAHAALVADHVAVAAIEADRIVPQSYAAKVAELSERFDLSPALIEALVWQESRWRAGAVSPKGARGLAQLMPGTARDLGVDPNDPFANLEGGARYLREQLDRFEGDVEKALAAYNAGPGRVMRAGGIPAIRETQTYVAAVMGRLSDHSRSPE